MSIYKKFTGSCLDLTILGLQDEPSIKNSPFPANARTLGWLPDSPVCFCQIREQGDTVFVADPSAMPFEQLLPVAEDILQFIGLLVSCPDATLIAGAYRWSCFRFRELLGNIKLGMKAKSVIRALKNTYQPPVIEDPGAMMSTLRKQFRANSPENTWKVGFDKDFSQPCAKGQCGKELVLNRSFPAENMTWNVPSVFLCNDGIVVDTFLEVSPDRLLDFNNKWHKQQEGMLSIAEKLQRQLDNPLTAALTGVLSVNDKPLRCKQSFTAIWNPLCDNNDSARDVLNHYRLDADRGYLFKRYCFLRKGKNPQIRTMQLTLEAMPVMVPGQTFTVTKDGMEFPIIHPATGLEHRFTAVSVSNEALNPNFLTNHPCYYTRMTYALEPSISPDNFRIVDTDPGDPWEGYQDDPAAVIYAGKKRDAGRYALSSLRYEPQEPVCWQMVFRRKLHQDIQLSLLP